MEEKHFASVVYLIYKKFKTYSNDNLDYTLNEYSYCYHNNQLFVLFNNEVILIYNDPLQPHNALTTNHYKKLKNKLMKSIIINHMDNNVERFINQMKITDTGMISFLRLMI